MFWWQDYLIIHIIVYVTLLFLFALLRIRFNFLSLPRNSVYYCSNLHQNALLDNWRLMALFVLFILYSFSMVGLVVFSGIWNYFYNSSIMEILLSNLWNLCSNVNLLLIFGHFFSFSPFLLARFIVPMKKHIYTIFIRCTAFHIGSLCYTFVDTDVVNLF